MPLKKCKDCGHEISTDAGKCPNCGRPKTWYTTRAGGLLIILALLLLVSMLIPNPPANNTTPGAPAAVNDPQNITDAQIYRDFERCMNLAKKQIDDNKLEARSMATYCVNELNQYGNKRAKKALATYYDLD